MTGAATARVPAAGPDDADAKLSVMAFVADDVTRQTLVRLASERGWRDPVIASGGLSAARAELSDSTSPGLLIFDLSESKDPLGEINQLADLCEPGTRVIALGTTNDVRLYRNLIDAGVTDYMVKPVAAGDLVRAVLHAVASQKPDMAEGKHGAVTAVIGARGGVGASMVALNLSWLLSQEQRQRVVLVDFDLSFGTVALSLDIDPGTGFRDVLQNPSRIDPLFLERASMKINDTLSILGMEDPLIGGGHWSAEAFVPLLTELGKSFDHIILDVPRSLAVQHPELIATAATTVMVSDLSLAAMRDALRLKALARENAPHTRLKIVVNHPRPAGKGDMPPAEFERSIEDKIACELAYDPKSVGQAAGTAKPLAAVARKAKVVEALRKLSQGMATAKAAKGQKKTPFALSRLFKS